jgi:hypothetical protein
MTDTEQVLNVEENPLGAHDAFCHSCWKSWLS